MIRIIVHEDVFTFLVFVNLGLFQKLLNLELFHSMVSIRKLKIFWNPDQKVYKL